MSRNQRNQFSQFSLDERAHVPVHYLSQTIGMTAAWLMMWKLVAPLVGVRVASPIVSFYNLFWRLVRSVAGAPAGASLVGPAVEFAFNSMLWLLPIYVALSGVATIWTAIEYGVDRVAGPPAVAVADPGGEV